MAILFQDIVTKYTNDKENLETMLYVEDTNTLCKYLTDQGYYKMMTDLETARMSQSYLMGNYPKSISGSSIKDFLYQIKLSMKNSIPEITSEYVALKDCLINVTTGELEPFNPKHLVHHKVNVSSDNLMQETPLFTKFLNQILINDKGEPQPDLIAIIQEMFGFALLQSVYTQKVFFLWGSGANGKSVLLHVLTQLIGEDFVSAKSIQKLTTSRFSITGLIGKKVNICNEEESKYIESAVFKALVSGDPVEGEFKYGGEVTFNPQTKFIFSTNRMPTFNTIDDALRRRFIIVPFKKKIEEVNQDKLLKEKLVSELGGIFKWAVEGAMRLVKNGYNFTTSVLTSEMLNLFEEEISSAIKYVREKYVVDENSFISNEDMYDDYRVWCEMNGRKPMNSHNFLNDITSALKLVTLGPKWDPVKGKAVRGRGLKAITYEPPPISY